MMPVFKEKPVEFSSSVSAISGAFTTTEKKETNTYSVKFDHPKYHGIPLTDNVQRLGVPMFGKVWKVTEISEFNIRLAEESTPAVVLNVGGRHLGESGNIQAGAYMVKLIDLTTPYKNKPSEAIVAVYDYSKGKDVLVKEAHIAPGDSEEITLPKGKIKIHVYKTSPGLTMSKWAEIAAFSNEINIRDGGNVNLPGPYNGWKVQFIVERGKKAEPDALKEIRFSK